MPSAFLVGRWGIGASKEISPPAAGNVQKRNARALLYRSPWLAYRSLFLTLGPAFEPLSHDIHSHPRGGATEHHTVYDPVDARLALKSDRPLDDEPQNSTWRNGHARFKKNASPAYILDLPLATLYHFVLFSDGKLNVQID